jgi:hypothetical protein
MSEPEPCGDPTRCLSSARGFASVNIPATNVAACRHRGFALATRDLRGGGPRTTLAHTGYHELVTVFADKPHYVN